MWKNLGFATAYFILPTLRHNTQKLVYMLSFSLPHHFLILTISSSNKLKFDMLLLSPHACCVQAQLAPLHKVPLRTFTRARFAFHSIGIKHPSVLLSLLCLNTMENMFITMLIFPKISDFKHSNIRPMVRRETPLSGLKSCCPP